MKFKGTQGNVAESKLKVGEIIEKYEEDDYTGDDRQKRREETKTDEERHCMKLKKFWANIRVDPAAPVGRRRSSPGLE